METTNEHWNSSMAALHTVKRYEEQAARPATISVGGGDDFTKNRTEEEHDSATWTRRFVSDPKRASTIISQLNNYHRLGLMANNNAPSDENPRAKNEVTPPTRGLKPPWEGQHKTAINEHPQDPPPLLLSGTDHAAARSNSDEKQVLTLPPRKGVPHIYHDYSNVPDVVGVVRKKTGGVTQPFPEKLHEMLNNDDDPSIVGWLPHGRAFLVRKPSEFTSQIMPKYFRQTKLTSFQRQLNLYGFRRLTQGADSGAYYHELFLRGRPQLCLRMQRQKIKGTGHKQPADVQTEPNFYNMPPSNQCNEMNKREFDSSNQVSTSVLRVDTKPNEATFRKPSFGDLSPKSRGAANLLKDLKSTFRSIKGRSLMDPSFSLGQPAMASAPPTNPPLSPTSLSSATHVSSHPGTSPPVANDLYATNQQSMSLLGRVQQFSKPLKMKPSFVDPASAFCWPPRKTPIAGSPSHTAVTFEESSNTLSPSPTDPYLVHTEIEGMKKPQFIDQRQRSRQRSHSSLSIGKGVEEKRYS